MANIIDQNRSIDQTVRVFDDFYKFDLVIPSNEFDVVNSYFIGICPTKEIAGNFTAFFFKIAQETGISALELLTSIEGKTALEMNQFISYYMNSFKSKASMYGISYIPSPNQTVQRNILQ